MTKRPILSNDAVLNALTDRDAWEVIYTGTRKGRARYHELFPNRQPLPEKSNNRLFYNKLLGEIVTRRQGLNAAIRAESEEELSKYSQLYKEKTYPEPTFIIDDYSKFFIVAGYSHVGSTLDDAARNITKLAKRLPPTAGKLGDLFGKTLKYRFSYLLSKAVGLGSDLGNDDISVELKWVSSGVPLYAEDPSPESRTRKTLGYDWSLVEKHAPDGESNIVDITFYVVAWYGVPSNKRYIAFLKRLQKKRKRVGKEGSTNA